MKEIRCNICGKKISKIKKCDWLRRTCCDCGNRSHRCYSRPLLRYRISCMIESALKLAKDLGDNPPTLDQQEAFGCSAEMIQKEWIEIVTTNPYKRVRK